MTQPVFPPQPIRGGPQRRSIRLRGYDYSLAGAYFVTMVTQDRALLWGDVSDGNMHLNDAGRMVERTWLDLSGRFATIEMDAFIVMPNHVHGIVVIVDATDSAVGATLVVARQDRDIDKDAKVRDEAQRAGTRPAPTRRNVQVALGDVIGAFKSITTHAYVQGVRNNAWDGFRGRVWQRNYYEHVIRNDASLQRIRAYIAANPENWADDHENPATVGKSPSHR